MSTIRLVNKDDLTDLKEVLNTIELFPSEMLEDMIADFFNNPNSEDIWFTASQNDKAIAIGYCAPEKLTDGTYNLYAIGVRNDVQAKGTGTSMMSFIENHLRLQSKRILIVETSSSDDFVQTRKFYEKLGYSQEAVIRDFWEEGDDKVIFWKKLN